MQAIGLHTILPIVICCTAAAEQTSSVVKELCTEAERFAAVLTPAREALSHIRTREQADAVVPAILPVHEAKARMLAAVNAVGVRETEFENLVKNTPGLRRALLLIPGEQFTRAVRREIAAGCHGSTRLFCALHNTLHYYTPEQLDAPLGEQDATTLQEAESAFRAIAAVNTAIASNRTQQVAPQIKEFCRAVRAAQPGISDAKHQPVAAMRLAEMAEQNRKHFSIIGSNLVYQTPEFQKLLREQRNNFFFSLFAEEYIDSLIHPHRK